MARARAAARRIRGGPRAQPRNVLDPRRLRPVRAIHHAGECARTGGKAAASHWHVPRRGEEPGEPELRAAQEPPAQGDSRAHLSAPALARKLRASARAPGRAQAELSERPPGGRAVALKAPHRNAARAGRAAHEVPAVVLLDPRAFPSGGTDCVLERCRAIERLAAARARDIVCGQHAPYVATAMPPVRIC